MSDLDAQYRTGDDVPSPQADSGGDDTGNWPRISDYWPDAPQRMGPEADHWPDQDNQPGQAPAGPQVGPALSVGPAPLVGPAASVGPAPSVGLAPPLDPAATRLISPPPEPGRSWLRVLLGALGALVFLGGSGIVLVKLVAGSRGGDSNASAPAGQDAAGQDGGGQNLGGQDLGGLAASPSAPVSIAPQPSATAAAPSSNGSPSATATALPFTAGTFELTGAVVDLDVTVAPLGNDPIRVTSPSGSGLHPRATVDGTTLKVSPNPDRKKGSGQLDVRLNARIAWSLKMTGGVTTSSFDLAGATVRRIDLVGGASRIDMALPSPAAVIPIRMSGGVKTWGITTVGEVPVRVLLRDGGGAVVLNGDRKLGIKRGTLLRADGRSGGGLAIDAVAGLGTLTVAPAAG